MRLGNEFSITGVACPKRPRVSPFVSLTAQ